MQLPIIWVCAACKTRAPIESFDFTYYQHESLGRAMVVTCSKCKGVQSFTWEINCTQVKSFTPNRGALKQQTHVTIPVPKLVPVYPGNRTR